MANQCVVCGSHSLNSLGTCMTCGADQVSAMKTPMLVAFNRAQNLVADTLRLLEFRLQLMSALAIKCGADVSEVTRIQYAECPHYPAPTFTETVAAILGDKP
jgi:hypothetical protein